MICPTHGHQHDNNEPLGCLDCARDCCDPTAHTTAATNAFNASGRTRSYRFQPTSPSRHDSQSLALNTSYRNTSKSNTDSHQSSSMPSTCMGVQEVDKSGNRYDICQKPKFRHLSALRANRIKPWRAKFSSPYHTPAILVKPSGKVVMVSRQETGQPLITNYTTKVDDELQLDGGTDYAERPLKYGNDCNIVATTDPMPWTIGQASPQATVPHWQCAGQHRIDCKLHSRSTELCCRRSMLGGGISTRSKSNAAAAVLPTDFKCNYRWETVAEFFKMTAATKKLRELAAIAVYNGSSRTR